MWGAAGLGARLCAGVALAMSLSLGATRREPKDPDSDISLWIDERQVRMFSVFAIMNGHIPPYILDPHFSHQLPTIPSEVGYVNFTWKSKAKKYHYHFDILTSSDPKVLKPPVLSIKTQGRVPKRPKGSLVLKHGRGVPLKGTPLRLNLKKECAQRGVYLERTGPDPECDKKCANQGWCNHEKICQCPEGYMGQHCRTALCYPQCMNGGNCTAPGKCLNGGKCIQKDTCECPKGYYGLRCEFCEYLKVKVEPFFIDDTRSNPIICNPTAKCVIPCLNGGRCKGVNKCRCPAGLGGNHCEVGRRGNECARGCRHGACRAGACVLLKSPVSSRGRDEVTNRLLNDVIPLILL
ncbi:hypothetical protein MSG28_011276 [Choristoneura fumiferana]|uniref:Uncharacterized protein n=1 Tax=Choristoneura fumiferana TaxID=7141 RepID=A0ACC0KRK0_CHOFU|nr:hypothetical protein MSG28_011276 [Choristoneura fumiferana]